MPQHILIQRKKVVLIADTTFFSRTDGLCVFREAKDKKNLWWKFVDYERVRIYEEGKNHLKKNGFIIQAVVLDGKRGVREVFAGIPVQMCHFHQKQIIRRYITLRPKLEASIALKQIMKTLTYTDKETFTEQLKDWHATWHDFLKEKTTNPETGKWFFSHKRLRSAYKSLQSNLPYLFTYQQYPQLNIPNTTNSLDGYFSVLKSKLFVHRGASKKRRNKITIELLKNIK